jgi:hypothetical protein
VLCAGNSLIVKLKRKHKSVSAVVKKIIMSHNASEFGVANAEFQFRGTGQRFHFLYGHILRSCFEENFANFI